MISQSKPLWKKANYFSQWCFKSVIKPTWYTHEQFLFIYSYRKNVMNTIPYNSMYFYIA